ncbi:MAG TPA: hypothetical protein VKR56_03110 [Candidatus Cybelea sp.]|nr:hypothetical protein [Candidatus Cybelea sp.]
MVLRRYLPNGAGDGMMTLFARVPLGVALALSVTACNGGRATPAISSTPAACSDLGQYVSVGGTAGFNTLARRDFTTALIATGHVRLYEHGTAIAAAIADSPSSNPYAILNAIERVFAGSGPGEAELGLLGSSYFTLPANQYSQYYQYQYVKSGLNPNAANVNVPYKPASKIRFDRRNVRAWKRWVRAARSVGIASMAPIVAPNLAWKAHSPIFPPTRAEYYDINSAFYELSRFEALYGGAIAFDSPPGFFLTGGSGPGYQKFIMQAIRWGNAHGLRTTMLVSPYPRAHFTADTQNFVSVLLAHDAVPTEWAVDDYENTDPNDAAAMGPDSRANTTTQVGLWLATQAPVYVDIREKGNAVRGIVCRPK